MGCLFYTVGKNEGSLGDGRTDYNTGVDIDTMC